MYFFVHMSNFILQNFEELDCEVRKSIILSKTQKMSKKEQRKKNSFSFTANFGFKRQGSKIGILSTYSRTRSRPVLSKFKSKQSRVRRMEENFTTL